MASRPATTLTLAALLLLLLVACQDRAPDPEAVAVTRTAAPAELPPAETSELPPAVDIVAPTSAVHLPLTAAGKQASATPSDNRLSTAETLTPSPEPAASTNTPLPPTATPVPAWLIYDGPPLKREAMGLQIHLHREDVAGIMADLRALDVGWVKTQVSWKLYQPAPDRFDDYRLAELDRFVTAADENGLKVLLSVAKAPEWSRSTPELDGPPVDFALFQSFMFVLATRYQGRVAAYELWNEANLQREWNGAPLSAASLAELMRAGATGVRAADPQALLISGAPATTGINDGVTAIDDRQYLTQMIAAGAAGVVDAIGAHPYGWANPPDGSAYRGTPSTSSHNDHPSFYFADTLADYRQILDRAGYTHMPIWATEFGWGSYDGLERTPPTGLEYMAEVSEEQQAIYTRRAFALAQEMPGVGPLILWNLNFAPTFGSEYAESSYSLLRPDGTERPVFEALAAAPRQ